MAAFLTRGLGNAAASYGEIAVEDSATDYVSAVTVRAGGATGGTGYITITGDVSVLVFDPTLCPCGVTIGIDRIGGPGTSPQTLFVVGADAVDGILANSGTIEWVFQVPSGANTQFALYADVFPADPMIEGLPVSAGTILGTMTAEYSPFGSTTVFAPTGEGGSDVFGQPTQHKERSLPR